MPEEKSEKQRRPLNTKPRQTSDSRTRQPYMHRNQSVHVPDGYMVVGLITGVHGLKGEVKVELHTDFPERFAPGVLLLIGDELTEGTIANVRPHKNQILLTLEGVHNRDEAEALRGQWLFVDEEDAVELEDDTYWVHDIVGMSVQTEDAQLLGTVKEVIFTGANEVYVVAPEPSVNQGKDLLLPAIADVVQKVDLSANLMIVRLLPGLLEE